MYAATARAMTKTQKPEKLIKKHLAGVAWSNVKHLEMPLLKWVVQIQLEFFLKGFFDFWAFSFSDIWELMLDSRIQFQNNQIDDKVCFHICVLNICLKQINSFKSNLRFSKILAVNSKKIMTQKPEKKKHNTG